jgi:DNA-binding MarR family transcriptional regulator
MPDPISVKKYLMERGAAPLGEISRHFGIDEAAVAPLVKFWIAKGRIRRHKAQGACSARCKYCSCVPVDLYEWIS